MLSGCRCRAAHQSARQRAGMLAVGKNRYAAFDDVPIAVHLLNQALAAGWEVEYRFGPVQGELVEIDHVDVCQLPR